MQTQSERKKLAADIKHSEDFVGNEQNPPADRKQIEDLLPQLKAKLESLASEEQQRQSDEIEGQEQLRAERTKLSELQEQLDRLQKALEHLGQLP